MPAVPSRVVYYQPTQPVVLLNQVPNPSTLETARLQALLQLALTSRAAPEQPAQLTPSQLDRAPEVVSLTKEGPGPMPKLTAAPAAIGLDEVTKG